MPKKVLPVLAGCKEAKAQLDKYLENFKKASQRYRLKNKNNPEFLARKKIQNHAYYEKHKEAIATTKKTKRNEAIDKERVIMTRAAKFKKPKK